MPFLSRTRRRRGNLPLVAGLAIGLAGGSLAVLPQSEARADTAPVPPVTTPTVSADVLPTVQVNGVVWSQVVIGNRVYATGSFTQARPAGAAPGSNQTARSNILAFDITTGALITSWAPTLNAQGLGIAAASDGHSVFVVGDFTSVSGATRRRAVELDATTGAVISNFNPNLDAQARAVAVNGDTVYLGGSFASASGVARDHAAAFSISTGALTTWAPSTDQQVLSLTAPAGTGRVVLGGRFTTINGTTARGSGAVDATTGATLPFPANQILYDYGPDAGIYSLRDAGGVVYGSGYNYLVNNDPASGGNFESVFAADAATGELIWVSGCKGDTYDVAPLAGVVYSVSHAHDCSAIGGHPQTDPWTFQRAMAFQAAPAADGRTNAGGSFNGRAAPELLHWYPTITSGDYTGQGQGAWSVTGNDRYVVLGGEFPSINGGNQQGLARFAIRSVAPNAQGPQGYAQLKPTVVDLNGRIRVSWQAAYDRDNRQLTYQVLRGASLGSATVLATLPQDSSWFSRPMMNYSDQSAPPGTDQTYRIRVTDGTGNTQVGQTTVITVPDAGTSSVYANAILGDGATHLWRLGEPSGTIAYDYAAADDLTVASSATRGADGALVNDNTATSTSFPGTTTVQATTTVAAPAPGAFAEELWFRTTSTRGGKLLGFGNSSTGNSSSYDRHLYLSNNGTLTFGVYNGTRSAITSPSAFNDGAWHHVVANLGPETGMELWVDGRRVAANAAVTSAEALTGYWRVAGDNTSGWPGSPSNARFTGNLEEVAIYPAPLSTDQIHAHYEASGRSLNLPARPTDAYGAAVWDAAPTLYWRLDEAGTDTTAVNRMSNLPSGSYSSGVVRGGTGAPANPAGTSIRLPGSGTQSVVAAASVTNPSTFSLETWFSTTTTTGGRLIGFGSSSSPTGTSTSYDRQVYMLDDGRLRYGLWTGSATTLDSTASYNDGVWHHLVASHGSTGMRLYVDGALVASGPQVSTQNYTGYWRLGTDNTWAGPSTTSFAGSFDEAAIYDQAISAATVAAHYELGRPAVTNQPPTAAFTSSTSGLTGSFSGAGSTDADGTVASYAWQFGDGTTGTGAAPSHTYPAAGTYDVVLTVTDDDGATGTVTHPVTVAGPANAAPTAAFTVTRAKLRATFDASGSADSDGTIASYAWDFGDGASGTGAAPSHTYAAAGTYTAVLTVTDDDGATGIVAHDLTVTANAAPHAVLGSSCTALACTFDGSASTDEDGTVASYAWDFGDGTTGTGGTPNHTYAAAGSYDVELTVTDDDGATDTATAEVVVAAANAGPTAAFSPSCTALACSFDASGSADSDGTIASYAWDFGDGTTGTGVSPNHTYAAAGDYSVALTVTDDDGAAGSTGAVVTVTAANAPPTAAFTFSCSGLACGFDAGGADDTDGSITGYAWDFGDGTTGTGVTPNHTYAAAGSYDVELTVTDDDSATGSVTRSVSPAAPANQAPTAAFTATPTGLTADVDGTGSSDPDGSVVSWAWDFGDGTTGSGATASHTYATGGSYSVQLTVTDDDGAIDRLNRTVIVQPERTGQDPVAAFTADCTGLACALDGSGSADADGSIASYAWTFGDGSTGTGVSPNHTYATAGTYDVVLTVTDESGAVGSITRAVTVSAPAGPLAVDAFGRTVASGFGTADSGGAWSTSGSRATASVSGGAGLIQLEPGATGYARLTGVSNLDTDVTHTVWTETMPTGGGAYLGTIVRATGAGDYYGQLKIRADGTVTVNLSRTGAGIGGTVTVPGLTYTAGTRLRFRVQATGSAPTTLRAKAWLASASEPTAWTVTATDSTAGYQVAGAIGFDPYVSGSATGPLAIRFDDLAVSNVG